MKQKRKSGRKLLSFLLTLVMLVGLMPGMSLKVRAETTTYTNLIPTASDDESALSSKVVKFNNIDWYIINDESSAANVGTVTLSVVGGNVDVTGISLTPLTGQTINVGEKVSFTASVSPDNATDKKVKWRVGGNDESAVKLYSDEACTTEVGADATDKLTVYAKGESAGSALVVATSNADSTKGVTCDVTVNKANPTAPTGLTATYGQKLSDVALPTGWTWADSTQSVGSVVSPAATFKANFAGDDNYNAASNVDVTVTVNKAGNPATVSDTATVTKGGNTVDLASNITLKGATGEVTYALDGDANGCTLNGSVLTSGDNTGNVTVNVSVAADNNYNALAATPITVTISDKGTQTITASDVTASYGVTSKKVTATTSGNGTISYAVKSGSEEYIDIDATTGVLTIKKIGTATVIITAAETDTFAQATKEVTVTITKAAATPATVTANNRTYDGTDKTLVTVDDSTLVGGKMWYALGENATTAPADNLYTISIPTATDAGIYYVWYKAVGDDAHSDSNPAVVTVTISEESPTEPETDDGKTETEQKGSAPNNEKTSIDNDLTEIREIVSEEASVDDSDTVRLILNTNSVDENSDENKKAVDSIKSMIEADNLNIGSFLDITLSYIVEDANGTEKSSGQLAELNGRSLSVRFPIPSKLQASGRLFRIFRFHGGKTEEIGSGRGDAVVLLLDKFSLYAIAYEDGAAPEETEESEKKVVKPHTHTYAWDKVEATESQDGELRYQCTECYDILVRVPLSAYYVFNANTVDKINKAKQGETVKITTDRWISFHKMVFDALTARPDVSLEVSFLDGEYKGNRVSFTIPAGADNSDLFTENNFAGFMYLGNKYGLTAEEN